MLITTTNIIDETTPVKIINGTDLGEYEALIQTQLPILIGGADITASNGFELAPIEDGIGDPRGFLKLRLQSEDLYALAKLPGQMIVNAFIYSV